MTMPSKRPVPTKRQLAIVLKENKRLHALNELMLKKGQEVVEENATLKLAMENAQEKVNSMAKEHSEELQIILKAIQELKKPT